MRRAASLFAPDVIVDVYGEIIARYPDAFHLQVRKLRGDNKLRAATDSTV
jgi:hypothetical protein